MNARTNSKASDAKSISILAASMHLFFWHSYHCWHFAFDWKMSWEIYNFTRHKRKQNDLNCLVVELILLITEIISSPGDISLCFVVCSKLFTAYELHAVVSAVVKKLFAAHEIWKIRSNESMRESFKEKDCEMKKKRTSIRITPTFITTICYIKNN
jgi:hypothetical protein